MMGGVELAIPTVFPVPKLMGSEVIIGARVCTGEAEARESDGISQFSVHKIEDCSSIVGRRGEFDTCALLFRALMFGIAYFFPFLSVCVRLSSTWRWCIRIAVLEIMISCAIRDFEALSP